MAAIPSMMDKTATRVVNDLYEAAERSRKNDRHYLGMSEIGTPCDRALWYGFRGFTPNPIEGRVIMLFRFGDHVEEDLIHWFEAAGYKVDQRQRVFQAHGGHFRGHWDGRIHSITQQPHVLECKSANKKKFGMFKAAGVRKVQPLYYCQCQCYMGYAGLERALVAIQCKDNSEIHLERIYFNRSDFKYLNQRAYRIITDNMLPERSFKKDTFDCQWCSFRLQCWYPQEVIVSNQVCGTCYYFGFKGLEKYCRHPDHPFAIQQWGVGCQGWYDVLNKDPRKKRPERLPIDELTIGHPTYAEG